MRAFSIENLSGWKTAAVRVFAQRVRLSGAASSCVSAKNILPEVNGMEKISRRIFSLFIVALLVVTLIPMGAFAEENIAEPQALVSGETQTCTFYVLYVDDSFPIGYNFGTDAKWNVSYTCAYTSGHSGYNHSMNCSVIKEQVNYAKNLVSSDWEIVGWSKEASANPQVFKVYSGTTATQTTYTIYIVAKKTTPAPTPSTEPTPAPTPSTEPTPTPTPSTEPTPAPTPSTEPTPTPAPSTDPTPDEPGDKVSVPGMLKTANGKTGEGAIGSLKRGDTVDFVLKTNVGEDMMWAEDAETGEKVQRLTQNKETGLWEGAEYKLIVTDAMDGPMVIDGDIAVSINGKDGSNYVTYTSKTDTGFVLSIDCIAALNDGVFTVDDIGTAVVLVTYTAKVNADAEDGAILKNTASVNGSADSVVTGDVTVPVEPPHTGGSGTAMFTVGGLVILAAAFVVLAVSRKKGKEN